MKRRILAFMIVMVLMIGVALPASAATKDVSKVFNDVSANGWYYTAVQHAFDNGLFEGKTPTMFDPYGGMTRGMFVTVLGRLAGVVEAEYPGTTYTDVPLKEYYAPYVKWAVSKGITDGTGNGKFSPNAAIKREEMVVFFARYAKHILLQDVSADGSLSQFTDAAKTSGWATTAMQWAVSNGIIQGDKGMLTPRATANRGQCAQILYNARELLAGKTWHEAVTEQVWVVDEAAYTKEEPKYEMQERAICSDCKEDITDLGNDGINEHIKAHALAGDKYGGWYSDWKRVQIGTETITVPEVGHYETRVIKEAGWY